MLSLLIFDQLSDLLYIKGDVEFIDHIKNLAESQGLSSPVKNLDDVDRNLVEPNSNVSRGSNCKTIDIDPNVVVQLFSPLVTSYRVMGAQFENYYSMIQCEDNTTIYFQQYAGYLFLGIGVQSEQYLQRFVNISIQLTKLIVGINVSILKSNQNKCKLLDKLLNAWMYSYAHDQCYLIEAVERLVIGPEVLSPTMAALASATDKLKRCSQLKPGHAVLFAGNKLVSLYSSDDTEELTSSDLLLLNLLIKSHSIKEENFAFITMNGRVDVTSPLPDDSLDDIEWDSSDVADDVRSPLSPEPSTEEIDLDFKTEVSVLMLKTKESSLSPHAVYFYPIGASLTLLMVAEIKHCVVGNLLYQVATLLDVVKFEESKEEYVGFVEKIDNYLRMSQDLAKKMPKASLIKTRKKIYQVGNRFEALKNSNFEEWLKNCDSDMSSRIESALSAVIDSVKSAWYSAVNVELPDAILYFSASARLLKDKAAPIVPILESKSLPNVSQSSCSIMSINKYMEEFPGLVHFLYVDRLVHQLTAPTLWVKPTSSSDIGDECSLIHNLTAAKVWFMVDFAREQLVKGRTSIIWKDKTFSYCYFLWFEDSSGNPLKATTNLESESTSLENLSLPGILCGDFYQRFAARVLPNLDIKKVRIYELFCIHLGLTTSPCILEQTRRLAATIWEVAGNPTMNPQDLL